MEYFFTYDLTTNYELVDEAILQMRQVIYARLQENPDVEDVTGEVREIRNQLIDDQFILRDRRARDRIRIQNELRRLQEEGELELIDVSLRTSWIISSKLEFTELHDLIFNSEIGELIGATDSYLLTLINDDEHEIQSIV
jgi:hypothetical protein